jgi:hypothetical protein
MNVRKSIADIAGATEKLSKGDNGIDLEKLTRGDELGAIVRSLKVFRDNQLHLDTLRAEQEKSAAMTADERRSKEEAAAAAARESRPGGVEPGRGPGKAGLGRPDVPRQRRLPRRVPQAEGRLQRRHGLAAGDDEGHRRLDRRPAHRRRRNRPRFGRPVAPHRTASRLAGRNRRRSGRADRHGAPHRQRRHVRPRTLFRPPVAKRRIPVRSCIKQCRPWARSKTRPSRSARSSV